MSASRRWILLIVGLLVANAAAMGYLVLASSTHPPKLLKHRP
jgi:hypothetical protein